MRKHLLALAAFAVALVLFSQTSFAMQEQKEWTFLVFINGHNNLDPYGKMNINQMEKVGSNKDLNILVQWASLQEGTVRRLYVEKDSTSAVTSPVIEDLGVVDMGDYRQLSDFIKWGAQNYPAKKYFVAVWNHGNGWNFVQKNTDIKPQDISYDDLSGNQITTEELGLVMKEAAQFIGHKVDIYGSDACLMAMIEIATEMQASAEYFVGSQELEPGEGWPYEEFLARWAANPKASAQEVSQYLTEEYFRAYSGGVYGSKDVTFSALNLNHLGDLNAALAELAKELKQLDANGLSTVKLTARMAQKFFRYDYKDLGNLVTMLSGNQNLKIQKTTLEQVQNSLGKVVAFNQVSSVYRKAQGLSIWIPEFGFDYKEYGSRYEGLEFHKQTGWGEFLKAVTAK